MSWFHNGDSQDEENSALHGVMKVEWDCRRINEITVIVSGSDHLQYLTADSYEHSREEA